jgi:hypothetical protein
MAVLAKSTSKYVVARASPVPLGRSSPLTKTADLPYDTRSARYVPTHLSLPADPMWLKAQARGCGVSMAAAVCCAILTGSSLDQHRSPSMLRRSKLTSAGHYLDGDASDSQASDGMLGCECFPQSLPVLTVSHGIAHTASPPSIAATPGKPHCVLFP